MAPQRFFPVVVAILQGHHRDTIGTGSDAPLHYRFNTFFHAMDKAVKTTGPVIDKTKMDEAVKTTGMVIDGQIDKAENCPRQNQAKPHGLGPSCSVSHTVDETFQGCVESSRVFRVEY